MNPNEYDFWSVGNEQLSLQNRFPKHIPSLKFLASSNSNTPPEYSNINNYTIAEPEILRHSLESAVKCAHNEIEKYQLTVDETTAKKLLEATAQGLFEEDEKTSANAASAGRSQLKPPTKKNKLKLMDLFIPPIKEEASKEILNQNNESNNKNERVIDNLRAQYSEMSKEEKTRTTIEKIKENENENEIFLSSSTPKPTNTNNNYFDNMEKPEKAYLNKGKSKAYSEQLPYGNNVSNVPISNISSSNNELNVPPTQQSKFQVDEELFRLLNKYYPTHDSTFKKMNNNANNANALTSVFINNSKNSLSKSSLVLINDDESDNENKEKNSSTSSSSDSEETFGEPNVAKIKRSTTEEKKKKKKSRNRKNSFKILSRDNNSNNNSYATKETNNNNYNYQSYSPSENNDISNTPQSAISSPSTPIAIQSNKNEGHGRRHKTSIIRDLFSPIQRFSQNILNSGSNNNNRNTEMLKNRSTSYVEPSDKKHKFASEIKSSSTSICLEDLNRDEEDSSYIDYQNQKKKASSTSTTPPPQSSSSKTNPSSIPYTKSPENLVSMVSNETPKEADVKMTSPKMAKSPKNSIKKLNNIQTNMNNNSPVQKNSANEDEKTATSAEVDLNPNATNNEKYRKCEEVLGKGANAVVKLAKSSYTGNIKNLSDEKFYAIKEFRKRRKNEPYKVYIKKVISEFCISSSIKHQNVVETVDLIQDENENWCEVMEYCSGGDLYSRINTGTLTDSHEINCYFKQLLTGVAYLHSVGVCHRDIKPENLLMDESGKILKITDFGVSEVFRFPWENGAIKRVSGLCGSEPYIAPEEWSEDADYDPIKVDIWACAIVYYSMNHMSVPWRQANSNDKYYDYYLNHINSFAPLEELPKYTREVIYGMLEPNPETRWDMKKIMESEWVQGICACGGKEYEGKGNLVKGSYHDHTTRWKLAI